MARQTVVVIPLFKYVRIGTAVYDPRILEVTTRQQVAQQLELRVARQRQRQGKEDLEPYDSEAEAEECTRGRGTGKAGIGGLRTIR